MIMYMYVFSVYVDDYRWIVDGKKLLYMVCKIMWISNQKINNTHIIVQYIYIHICMHTHCNGIKGSMMDV